MRADSRALDVMGLVDSGATVHVLASEEGLQFGVNVFSSTIRLMMRAMIRGAAVVTTDSASQEDLLGYK